MRNGSLQQFLAGKQFELRRRKASNAKDFLGRPTTANLCWIGQTILLRLGICAAACCTNASEAIDLRAASWRSMVAGSALPWHGRGHRFDPDQVHQITQQLSGPPPNRLPAFCPQIAKSFRATALQSSFPLFLNHSSAPSLNCVLGCMLRDRLHVLPYFGQT